MKNIDKVREMSPEELVKFMKSDICNRCTYNGTNCHHDMCTKGMTEWLEQESELTIEEAYREIERHCNDKSRNGCNNGCEYSYKRCQFGFIIDNFNIIGDKITRK